MNSFIFDLQRFDSTVTIASGTSQTIDDVTYTATSDAVLNLDDEGAVSGIASGVVVAKLTDADSSPQITFDGSTAFAFSCSSSDSALQVKASGTSISYTGGKVTYSADGFSGAGEVSVTGYMGNILPFDVVFDIPDSGIKFTFDSDNNTTTLNADEKVNATLTFPESAATLIENIKPLIPVLLNVDEDTANKLYEVAVKLVSSPTTAQIQGVQSWNQNDKKLTLNQNSLLAFNVLDYNLSMTAEGGNVDGLSFFYQLTNGTELSAGAKFIPNTDENAGLNLTFAKNGSQIYDGVLKVTSGAIDIDVVNAKASVEKDTAVTMTLQDGSLAEFKFDNAASITYSANESGLAYLTFGENDGKLEMTIYRGDTPVFKTGIEINGSLTLDTDNQTVGMTKDTTTIITIGNNTATINVTDDAGFKIGLSNDAITITPQEDDGSLNISLSNGDETVFKNTVSVSNGSIIFNPATQEMTLTDGTTISFLINDNYTLTATASGDATSKLSLSTSGIAITPSTGDGSLDLTLTGTSSGSLSANIKVLSGSFTLGEGGALTVAKDTELQITFSDDYIVNFKAIDDAGGTLSLGTDGLTFAPGDGDGGLELSITRGDEKRTASLDVTGGSVTYKLDGSISLTQGTVVKNVFKDGNILTITANTDASGTMRFSPDGGLTIIPSTADALTVSLTTGDLEVVKISSITGSINYSGGVVTASDGTRARITYYFGWKSDLYTEGGTASLQFTADRTIYTANEGANFVIDYLDGTTAEIQSGTYSDIYATETSDAIELVSEGSTFRSNDGEQVITLEKAGNYTLNGMDITTSKDNVEVQLPDYNTVTFAADAGITYNGQEFSGDGIVSIINGNVTIGQIISNTTANTLISGGDGFDSISNSEANNVTITALGGNDTIINDHAYYPSIDGGDGNDYIVVQRGDHSYIDGGAGKDTILGDASNDWAMGGYATINGGDGDDYIDTSSSDSSSIMGGAGDDIIITSGNDSTLNGGAGDDIISLTGASIDNNVIEYETDSGNDIIYGLNSTGIISLTTGAEYSTDVSGDDVILTVGENKITVAGASAVNVINAKLEPLETTNTASNTLVTGTSLADSISNRGSNVTIDAQAGKDIVFNFGAETSISGGAGDDSIYNEGADGSTIEGDYGDDYLWNNSANVLINGNYGNDKITNSGDNVTVKPSGGNDSIFNDGGENFVVEYTGGNDTITGFNENSTLQIVGASYASVPSDNDVIVTVGDNMVKLTGAANLDKLNIVGTGSGDDDTTTAATVAQMMLYRTEAGYPVIAGLAFHPTVYHGDEPTNYASKETWTIKSSNAIESAEGLELSGVHYTPENSNDKWVVIIHGYGHNHKHMYPFAGFFLDNGYNVLMVDQRAAGDSEGSWLTMGTAESADIALWTQEIARRNSDAKITLFGVSMGAATAMLAASRSDIVNVTSLIEDCGYTNVMDVVYGLHSNSTMIQSLLPEKALPVLDTIASTFTGYNLSDAAPLDSISAAKMPTLFITGTADTVVPVSMLTTLYDASGAEVKETFSVEGATHGVAGLHDSIGYSNTVFRFVAEADEEGWNTSNVTNDISLRGTKYNDTIDNSGYNVTISTGEGNDTITSGGASVSIDAGTGENLIVFTDEANSNTVVLSGNTTVEGFKTGFGEGSDTIYIDGDPAGVEFKSDGLAFANSTDSLALSGITTTSKVNIYHERRSVLNKGVFIAENDWYSVQSSDLTVGSGEEVYFVGTTSESQVGVDFGGISSALNVTMDTAYEDSEDFVPGTTTWINSVYSLRGGAGNTTVTGSKNSDTIIAGTGATTIKAAAGDDNISLGSSAALVQYTSGDGNDTIEGFNRNSTLQIGDGTGTYSTQVSGSDVVVTVGDEAITLVDASDVRLNIIGDSGSVSPQPTVATKTVEEIKEEIGADSIQTASDDTLKVNNDDGNNLVYVDEDAKGSKKITLGAGGDAVVIESAKANVSVTGGKGNDSLIVKDSAAVEFDMSKGGADKIYLASDDAKEKVTLKGYNVSNNGGIVVGTSDIAGAIQGKDITFGNGLMQMGAANAKVTFAGHTGYSGSTTVKLFDDNDEAQAVGFTNLAGGNLNVSTASDDYLLVGNYFDDKSGGSTIAGGNGNDTILAGGGDVVNAGAGHNQVILDTVENRDGADIILNSGKTTVQNFKAGFDDSDRVFFGVNDVIDFKFDGTNVSVQSNNVWRGVLSGVGDGADFVNILSANANGPVKVAVAQEGAVIAVEDELADYYIGEKSGVDFTNYSGELMANLGSQETSIGTGEVLFAGINQITASSGQTTLMGSAKNETLYAGTGAASIYGGGGRNLLANTATDKDSSTTFFVLGSANSAKNTIAGFNFAGGDGVADKIEVDTNTNVVSNVAISGNDVIIDVSNRAGTATERAVIQGAVGQNMQFGNNVVAQVNATDLIYDGTANFFVATGNNASISVATDVGTKAEIWLDGKPGNGLGKNFVGDIRTIDATASSVKVELAGNDTDNTILAGSGDTSLWGGNGGDDFMQGGAGHDSFFYTNGNGNDTISGSTAGDVVFLSEMTLDQISTTAVSNGTAVINFKDGGSLTVGDAANCQFVMTQGDQYQVYRVSGNNFVNA